MGEGEGEGVGGERGALHHRGAAAPAGQGQHHLLQLAPRVGELVDPGARGVGRRYQDRVKGEFTAEGMAAEGMLLFGRRTYEDLMTAWTAGVIIAVGRG